LGEIPPCFFAINQYLDNRFACGVVVFSNVCGEASRTFFSSCMIIAGTTPLENNVLRLRSFLPHSNGVAQQHKLNEANENCPTASTFNHGLSLLIA
jgi:hypothetical protein